MCFFPLLQLGLVVIFIIKSDIKKNGIHNENYSCDHWLTQVTLYLLATEAEGDVPELYHQRKGEIARCWIKYCLTLMQNAQLSMQVIQSKVIFSVLNSRM